MDSKSDTKNIRIEYEPPIGTTSEEEQAKFMILKTLSLGDEELLNYWIMKLEKYYHMSSLDMLKCGQYVRFVDRRKEKPVLAIGGIVVYINYDKQSVSYLSDKRLWNIQLRFCEVFIRKKKQEYLLELFKDFLSKENSRNT
jgi:hypothetical protein